MFLGKVENESEVRLGHPVLRIPVFLPGLPTMLAFRLLFIYDSSAHLFVHSFLKESSTLQGIELEDPAPGEPGCPAFPFTGE